MDPNEQLISSLVSQNYADERIANAMRRFNRKDFIPQVHENSAYVDHPLPIGKGQTISAPGVVAFMSKHLDVKEGMKILEIGCGSGWQAAILGNLVGKGEVWSIERIPELVENASNNLEKAGAKNVYVILGDGTKGYSEKSPFDRIMVTAAAPEIPPPLIEQLKEEGKLIMPVGGSLVQELVLVEKSKKQIKRNPIMSVVFVPLIGEYGYRE